MLPTLFGSLACASSLVVKAKLIFRANKAPIQIRQLSPSQTVLTLRDTRNVALIQPDDYPRKLNKPSDELSASPLSAKNSALTGLFGSYGVDIEESRLGLTMIIAEQNFNQTTRIADRGYVIVHGKIADEGTSRELQQSNLVQNCYLGL
jgi:ABC-type cobalamin transport system ATPase subunit